MSKKPWTKHENVEDEILNILRNINLATANVILSELKRENQISYGSVKRRLKSLLERKMVECLNIGASQVVWKINRNVF